MSVRALVSIYNESTSTWFHIGGDSANIPAPYDYDGTSSTVVDTARNSVGTVVAQVIKEDIAKVELKWNFLTISQYSSLAQLFDKKYGGDFFNYVSYFDVVKGDWNGNYTGTPDLSTNRRFYVGDRKVSFAHITLDSNGKPIGYSGVQLHLIDTGARYGE